MGIESRWQTDMRKEIQTVGRAYRQTVAGIVGQTYGLILVLGALLSSYLEGALYKFLNE